MQLDEKVFRGVTSALGAIPDASPALQRRRSQRYHVDREIGIRPFGVSNAASHSVTLVNISAGGLCIVDRLPVSVGDQFTVTLPVQGGAPFDLHCIVRQSRLTSIKAYRVGAEFVGELEKEERLARPERASTQEAAPADSELQPAVLHLASGSTPISLRTFGEGLFEVRSARMVTPGEQVTLELRFHERRQAWKCTVLETRDAPGGKYLMTLRNDGPSDLPDATGPLVWLKRLLRRS